MLGRLTRGGSQSAGDAAVGVFDFVLAERGGTSRSQLWSVASAFCTAFSWRLCKSQGSLLGRVSATVMLSRFRHCSCYCLHNH